jgi:two-component system LytT family response regulator
MSPIRTVVVDDEGPARRGLCLRLADDPRIVVVGEADGGRAALRAIAEQRPALLLLDVQMPVVDGFDVLRALPRDLLPQVVFVTAFDRHAVRAFEVHALDFLLKPVETTRLRAAIDRAVAAIHARTTGDRTQRLLDTVRALAGRPDLGLDEALDGRTLAPRREGHLTVRTDGRTVRVPCAEIDCIEAAGDYMCIHTPARTFLLRTTLGKLLARLDPTRFVRVHRSTIVGSAHVREIVAHANGEATLVLAGGRRVKASRGYREALLALRR